MHGIRKGVLRVLLASAVTGAVAAATLTASAAVPSIRPTIWVVPTVGAPGSFVTVTGMGFTCSGPVSLHIQYPKPLALWPIGNAKPAVGLGRFEAHVRIPRDAQEGMSRILALQGDCNAIVRFRVCSFCAAPAVQAPRLEALGSRG